MRTRIGWFGIVVAIIATAVLGSGCSAPEKVSEIMDNEVYWNTNDFYYDVYSVKLAVGESYRLDYLTKDGPVYYLGMLYWDGFQGEVVTYEGSCNTVSNILSSYGPFCRVKLVRVVDGIAEFAVVWSKFTKTEDLRYIYLKQGHPILSRVA